MSKMTNVRELEFNRLVKESEELVERMFSEVEGTSILQDFLDSPFTPALLFFTHIPGDKYGRHLVGTFRKPANEICSSFCEIYKDSDGKYTCFVPTTPNSVKCGTKTCGPNIVHRFDSIQGALQFLDEHAFNTIECFICELETLQDRRPDLVNKMRKRD